MPAAPHCECNERIALAEATRHLTSPTLASPRPPSACPKRATPPACPGSAAQVELALRACVSQEPLQEQEPLSLVLLLLYLLLPALFVALTTTSSPAALPATSPAALPATARRLASAAPVPLPFAAGSSCCAAGQKGPRHVPVPFTGGSLLDRGPGL